MTGESPGRHIPLLGVPPQERVNAWESIHNSVHCSPGKQHCQALENTLFPSYCHPTSKGRVPVEGTLKTIWEVQQVQKKQVVLQNNLHPKLVKVSKKYLDCILWRSPKEGRAVFHIWNQKCQTNCPSLYLRVIKEKLKSLCDKGQTLSDILPYCIMPKSCF